jgi:putative transposase
MADLTEIPSLFRLFSFKLAVVFDAFSRMPVLARVFRREPRARDLARLIADAAALCGAPRHFVSDQGTQFTAAIFRQTLGRLRLRQRFGAVGKTGSIALIERLWRTLKDMLGLRFLRPLLLGDLRQRIELGLFYYAYLRPHEALGGATPSEIYFGLLPAHLAAVSPPRGNPGQGPRASPFEIRFLDPERRLPFLAPRAA